MITYGSIYLISKDFDKSVQFYKLLLERDVIAQNMNLLANNVPDGKHVVTGDIRELSAKLSNIYQDRVDVAKSLFGVLSNDMTLETAREERVNTYDTFITRLHGGRKNNSSTIFTRKCSIRQY